MKRLLGGLILALPGLAVQAGPVDDAVAVLCRNRPAPAQTLGDFDTALVGASGPALSWACARWRDAPDRRAQALAAVDVALAQAHGDEPARAAALVAALRADPALREWPVLQPRIDRAALVLAYDAKDFNQVARDLPALRAALQAQGGGTSVAMLELWLLDARAARSLRRAGWAEQADAALAEAGRLLDALGLARHAWAGEVYNARSMQAYARDDIPGALQWTQRELALAEQLGQLDDPELIHTYLNIANHQYQLHQLDAAEQTYRSAQALAARHPEAGPYALSGLHANHAVFLFARGRWRDALAEAQRADDIARRAWGERSPRRVQPLIHVAESQRLLNQLKAALQTLDLALELARPAGANLGPLRLMRLHEDRAQVLAALGQLDAAAADIEAGLAQDPRAEASYWRARSLWQRALLQSRRGEWRAAEADLAAAEPVLAGQLGAGNPWLLQLTADRCRVQLRLAPQAEACERLAAVPVHVDENAYRRAERLAARADAAQARGDRPAELELRLAALAAAQHVEGPEPLWRCYAALARLLHAEGRRSLAVLVGKQAVAALEALRRDAGAEALSMERGFLDDKRPVYEALAGWLTEDGRLAEALATLDLLRAQEFHDFVRGTDGLRGPVQAGLPWTPGEQRELALWQAEALALDPARPPERLDLAEQQAQRERNTRQQAREAERVARWQARLAEPGDAQGPPPREPLPLRAARGVLHVHAYTVDSHLNLVIDSADGRRLLRLPVDKGELDRRVGQWLAAITARRDDAALTRYFGQLLASPLRAAAAAAQARRLVLHLSGNLRYLPWAALDDGRGPLGAGLALEQAATPVAAGAALRQARLQVLALTRASGTEPALPALAQEVCAIVRGPLHGWAEADPPCQVSGALPGQAWLNTAFTRAQLAASVAAARPQRSDLLHLGSHFTLRPGLMSASSLLLGDGSRMSLAELALLDFKGQELVTLSACETGMGGDGAEVEGLSQVILRRGAGRVLASLWRVDDRSTAVLMATFYRALAAGRAPAEALAEAQARVRREPRWRAPFHWAAFYLGS